MLLKPLAILMACSVAASPAPLPMARAFPSLIMIRGGTLKEPIAVFHDYKQSDIRKDPVVILSTSVLGGKSARIPPQSAVYEVAELWIPGYRPESGKDGKPVAGMPFPGARGVSAKLYVSGNTVIWVRVLGEPERPGLRPISGTLIDAAGLAVLRAAGLPH